LTKYHLALIGKDINHSQSPKVYKDLLKNNVEYALLDFAKDSEILSLESLFEQFDGISITSPYKKHFLDEVHLNDSVRKLNAINCIRKINNMYEGTNTDYIAVGIILKNYLNRFPNLVVVILGAGSMSSITQVLLDNLKIRYSIKSRKGTEDFNSLNLKADKNSQLLVINSCSREYCFNGEVDKNALFWDFNYSLAHHQKLLPSLTKEYVDGQELLFLQAREALSFWGINQPE
jgi:shikimate dehydrogenase